jgi:hypothetical protein
VVTDRLGVNDIPHEPVRTLADEHFARLGKLLEG